MSRQERLERYWYILEQFGPPADMFLVGGIPAMLSIQELERSFVAGNFLAVVLLAQVFIEHSLGGEYGLRNMDDIVEGGLARLVTQAGEDGLIGPRLAETLHELRRMRNPYTHPHGGVTPRSYLRRLFDHGPEPFALAERDARQAIEAVVDFMRDGSPNWKPPDEGVRLDSD